MRVPLNLRHCVACATLMFATASSAVAQADFSGPVVVGQLAAPPGKETSGIAASRRSPDLLWTHDDSGGAAMLYAVSTTGALRGRLQIRGEKNHDWEDLAAATLDGQPWIVIADTGDNEAKRKHVSLFFMAEPDPATLTPDGQLAARPAHVLRLTYDDGPRDCEAIAIDPVERAVYLLAKRTTPPRLYRVALPTPLASGSHVAAFVGPVPHVLPKGGAAGFFGRVAGPRIAMPCAMDFTPDRSMAVVLTYSGTLLFPRGANETWAAALAREPVRLGAHYLPQAEAVCFSLDGRAIFAASEESPDLLRYDRK